MRLLRTVLAEQYDEWPEGAATSALAPRSWPQGPGRARVVLVRSTAEEVTPKSNRRSKELSG